MSYNPIKLLIAAAWFYASYHALAMLEKRDMTERNLFWSNLFAFFAGPLVIVYLYTYDYVVRTLERMGMRRLARKRAAIKIEIRDSTGKVFAAEEANERSEVPFLTRKILFDAVKAGASDIFFDPKSDGSYHVRYRCEGMLNEVAVWSQEIGSGVIDSMKLASGMDTTEHRRPQEGSFSGIVRKDTSVGFHSAVMGAVGGEKLSIHLSENASAPQKLADLKMRLDIQNSIRQALAGRGGLILLCGPSKSGKTTTLYSLFHEIDCSKYNVISIEDPIFHALDDISQLEVSNRSGFTCGILIRNALAQNPDIIAVGEIRDRESAMACVNAARTGHLIVATLNCRDNRDMFERMANLGVAPHDLVEVLQLSVSQALLRTLCKKCRQSIALPDVYREIFTGLGLAQDQLCSASGCRDCDGSGYAGVQAVFDALEMTDALKTQLGSQNTSIQQIQQTLDQQFGNAPLYCEALSLVATGVTTFEEAGKINATPGI
ncbi:MAG: ATPase, T2SS/T4P/T4SS family [Victivallaceae bacterium]|nr:ATPase, T2SS/T4P/T4SS family [Victivallaceae bacterium]